MISILDLHFGVWRKLKAQLRDLVKNGKTVNHTDSRLTQELKILLKQAVIGMIEGFAELLEKRPYLLFKTPPKA